MVITKMTNKIQPDKIWVTFVMIKTCLLYLFYRLIVS
jgi:hypothetical protein